MKKELLKTIIRDFHLTSRPALKPRSLDVPVDTGKIVTLVGVRRCGKTSLLFNTISRLEREGVPLTSMLYINFEDERLELKTQELDLILQAWQELYPDMEMGECSFFFDEIQNIEGWDKFVRRIYDRGQRNIFITGSNAKLLSHDIATSLRGRSISYAVFPLSFGEYLSFRQITPDLNSSSSIALLNHHLQDYLRHGGFPEVIDYGDALRNRVLQEYFSVMIYRDMVERYEIRNLPALKFFLKRIIASATKQFSVNKIYNELKSSGFRIGKNQLYDFLEGAQNIHLAQTLRKHSDSPVERELGERKVYVIDTGLLSALDFKFSDDTGKALEEAVFLELKRREKEIYFFRDKAECDFLVKEGEEVTEAIQVSASLDGRETRLRELRGLCECCRRFGLRKGVIVTLGGAESFDHDGIGVTVVPLYRWLLQP